METESADGYADVSLRHRQDCVWNVAGKWTGLPQIKSAQRLGVIASGQHTRLILADMVDLYRMRNVRIVFQIDRDDEPVFGMTGFRDV